MQETWFDPWVGKIPWRRKWQPTAVVLPGESQGQRSLSGCSPRGCKRVRHNRACIHVLEAKDVAQGFCPGETISPEGGQRGGDHHVLVPQELSQRCRKPLRDWPREPFASLPGLPPQGKSKTDLYRMLELLMSICTSQIQALEAEDLNL